MDTCFQIFYDTTGKRKKVVNFFLFIISIIVLCMVFFIGYKIFGVEEIKNLGRKTQKQQYNQKTNISMLYTENSGNSLTTFSEQINSLDTVIIPRYLVSNNSLGVSKDYEELYTNICFLEENNPTHYKKYFLLSELDYSQQPTEINNKTVNNYFSGTSQYYLNFVVNDLIKNKADGVLIETSLQNLNDDAKLKEFLNLLNSLKQFLDNNNIDIGLKINMYELNSNNSAVIQRVDYIYVDFNYANTFEKEATNLLAKKDLISNKKMIIELPTVSSKVSSDPENDYINSISYKDVEETILNLEVMNRNANLFSFIGNDYKYVVRDAVEAYNYIMRINYADILDYEQIEFCVSDPGFEEYTTWKILSNNGNRSEKIMILKENVQSTMGVNSVGSGRVFEVLDIGDDGKRKIETNTDGQIITSTVQKIGKLPIINKSGKSDKKVALTFDDGPHPIFTRRILDILERYNVKGTFYVVGENVASYPSIAKEITARGHEIESHSYGHPHFNFLDKNTIYNQVQANNKIIEEITSKKPSFFRLPYGEDTELDTSSDIDYLLILRDLGVRASEYDIDSKDWESDEYQDIVEKVIWDIENSAGNYSQILFHDSSKNTEKTILALPEIIEYLRANNIEIVTVNNLVNEETAKFNLTTTSTALDIMNFVMKIFSYLMIFFFCFSALKYIWIVIGMIIYNLKKVFNRKSIEEANYKKRISIIIACYNEEKVIAKTIESLQANTFKKLEIIIANDGSTDKTAEIVKEYAKKDKRVVLLDLEHGGKAMAIDAGIDASTSEWLVFCDADTVFQKRSIEYFSNLIAKNGKLAAVAGRILVGNDLNPITHSQLIEYAVAHRFIKPAQDSFRSITVVPGAIGLWKKKTLIDAGGFAPNTLAEDADTTMKVTSLGNRVRFNDSILARTEVPETYRMLFKQRTRWQLGNMQALRKHYKGIFNYKYGLLGFIGLPMLIIEIVNAILFPLFIFFLIWLNVADYFNMNYVFSALEVEYVYSDLFRKMSFGLLWFEIFLCVGSITVERTYPRWKILAYLALPYYFTVYKAFLSYATIVSLFRALRGTNHGWNHVVRTSHVKSGVN